MRRGHGDGGVREREGAGFGGVLRMAPASGLQILVEQGEPRGGAGLGEGAEPSREGRAGSGGRPRPGVDPGWSPGDTFSRQKAVDGCGNLGRR